MERKDKTASKVCSSSRRENKWFKTWTSSKYVVYFSLHPPICHQHNSQIFKSCAVLTGVPSSVIFPSSVVSLPTMHFTLFSLLMIDVCLLSYWFHSSRHIPCTFWTFSLIDTVNHRFHIFCPIYFFCLPFSWPSLIQLWKSVGFTNSSASHLSSPKISCHLFGSCINFCGLYTYLESNVYSTFCSYNSLKLFY